MLAEAVAKNEGYKFSPDANCLYKQGYSSEKSFIFTTTQFVTTEWLERMRYELKEDESILICTTHYEENCNKYETFTLAISMINSERVETKRAKDGTKMLEMRV